MASPHGTPCLDSAKRHLKVLVTGGSGTIGGSIAHHFEGHGADVVLVDKRPINTSASHGGQSPTATLIIADVADPASCQRAVNTAADELGGIDILVNAAGIQRRRGLDVSAADWEAVLRVNLSGALWMVQATLPLLRASRCGSVVNVASSKAMVATIGDLSYSTSKAALVHLTKLLAVEVARDGVRVNAVAPTLVPTPMTADLMCDREYLERKLGGIPLGRHAQPDDVANAVCFLTSSQSSMITGQTLLLDGGETLD